jgi:hypothetical protein
MFTLLLLGALLMVVGIGGAVSACVGEDSDYLVSVLAGLSLALGSVLLILGAARRGYHYRPAGSPPGDMDPEKAELPTPENPPTR